MTSSEFPELVTNGAIETGRARYLDLIEAKQCFHSWPTKRNRLQAAVEAELVWEQQRDPVDYLAISVAGTRFDG